MKYPKCYPKFVIILYCILKYLSYIGYFFLSYWASLVLTGADQKVLEMLVKFCLEWSSTRLLMLPTISWPAWGLWGGSTRSERCSFFIHQNRGLVLAPWVQQNWPSLQLLIVQGGDQRAPSQTLWSSPVLMPHTVHRKMCQASDWGCCSCVWSGGRRWICRS